MSMNHSHGSSQETLDVAQKRLTYTCQAVKPKQGILSCLFCLSAQLRSAVRNHTVFVLQTLEALQPISRFSVGHLRSRIRLKQGLDPLCHDDMQPIVILEQERRGHSLTCDYPNREVS